jgi:GT2 family glycosyltransferase
MASVRFSVLIVAYNSAAVLPGCLQALKQQTYPADQFELLILDNASTEPVVDVPLANARVIRSEKNLGFAGGNNALVPKAIGTMLVLLNPDTEADPFWLEELARCADENPGCAIASKLLMQSDPRKLNSTGLFLLKDGRGADRGFQQLDDGRYEAGGDVFAGCGAALALPNTGEPIFDDKLFLYSEDLELGWRRQKAGLRTVFCPRAVVLHAVGANDHSPTYWYYSERNRARVALRHGDVALVFTSTIGLILRAGRAVLFSVVRHPSPKYRWRNGWAVVRAMISHLLWLPAGLVQKYAERTPRKKARP